MYSLLKKISIQALAGLLCTLSVSSCGKKNDAANTSVSKQAGTITYTINGKSYTQTDDISITLIGGQFAACTDGNLDAKIGDGEMISPAAGTTKAGCYLGLKADGIFYARAKNKNNSITIISYDGGMIKGTFSGILYKDGDSGNNATPVNGTFETNNIDQF